MESTGSPGKATYKEKVMSMVGGSFGEELLKPEKIVQYVTEEVFPELRTEKENETLMWDFNPKPHVQVSTEEYEQWCKPWKNTLVVRLPGKRTYLRFMSNRHQ